MLKLGYYLAFKQKIQKWKNFEKKPKNHIFRGLEGEKLENNSKYAKTRVLSSFWAKNTKMKFFWEKPKKLVLEGAKGWKTQK